MWNVIRMGKKQRCNRVGYITISPFWGYHIFILISTSKVRISSPWFLLYGSVLCLKTSTVYSQMVKSWSLHIPSLIHLCCSNPCSRVPTREVTTTDLVRVKAFQLQLFGRQVCICGVAIQTMTQISQFGGCVRIT